MNQSILTDETDVMTHSKVVAAIEAGHKVTYCVFRKVELEGIYPWDKKKLWIVNDNGSKYIASGLDCLSMEIGPQA